MRRPLTAALARHSALTVAAILVLFPFLWIAAAAFKTQIALLSGQGWFAPTLMNFNAVLLSRSSDYSANFINSMIVGLASTAVVLVVSTLGAYSIDRMRWPRWFVHSLLLWSAIFHMIPPITMVGAWYVMFRSIGLDNTYTGLILAHVTLNLPMALWLMAAFIREVPVELEEAARIDGCSTPRLLWKVIVPLVAPGLAATGILVFVFSWNEFAVALNLTERRTATVPVAIARYAQEFDILYTQMAAGALLSTIPALLLLLFGQRYIVKGLTAGSLK
jgi:multiple sugar transport system permease protein